MSRASPILCQDRRARWLSIGQIVAIALGLAACGVFRSGPEAGGAAPLPAPGSPVELLSAAARPRLSLVHRTGDPASGVAMAVAHDRGSMAAAFLAALIEQRMRKSFESADVVVHDGGFFVRALVARPEDAARFVRSAAKALAEPLGADDAPRLERRVRAMSFSRWNSAAAEAVARCSGELGAKKSEKLHLERDDLERARSEAYSWRSVAFAAVGPRPVLQAISSALEATPAWPDEGHEDPWPRENVMAAGHAELHPSSLSVALRLSDAARAVEAARGLVSPASALRARADALEPSWRVDHVAGSMRTRGACLRADLTPRDGAATLEEAARVAAIVADEIETAAERARSDSYSLDEGILTADDPREAAAIAAFRALSGLLPPGPPRLFVSFEASAPLPDSASKRFASAVRAARAERREPTIDVAQKLEPGQGQIWLLLASPCGTGSESTADAGLRALVLRTMAEQTPEMDGVLIEHWATPDGMGLLAHAPRAHGTESPERHAERVASALGRAFAATRLRAPHVAAVRTALLSELDPEASPLWSVVLTALSPDHPSWLDPRGTFQSVTELTSNAAELERRALARGPLRLAALVNAGAAQVDIARATLERWLSPYRSARSECPATTSVVPRFGEYAVETSAAPRNGTRALVAVPFMPSPLRAIPEEAEWTVTLLNRQGGWLDAALGRTGIAENARATLLGGRHSAGLVVEIGTLADKGDEAVAQVRALLSRLSSGAASETDLAVARREHSSAERRARLDPRQRVVDLWRDRLPEKPPDLVSFRRFHQNAFAPERHVVVVSRPKP